MNDVSDPEQNRLSRRVARYARVGTNVGGVAARMAGTRLFGRQFGDQRNAADLAATLGGLKGPLMKIGQMIATVPDLLPPEYATELQKLQASAPPMGPAFVRRRMRIELGPDWERRFKSFDSNPAAAASLGQVHRAIGHDGGVLACKLQYPDMQSAVEADLGQMGMLLAVQRQFSPEIDTSEISKELAERLREELDYSLEARHMALYRAALQDEPLVRIPTTAPDLSTKRLLTMSWLDGRPLLANLDRPLEERNRIATAMFRAWWVPFADFGVIHGDPHLGNYTVFDEDGSAGDRAAPKSPGGINLLDFGCIRVFPPRFVKGVVELFHGLKDDTPERVVEAYQLWGFEGLNRQIIDVLNIWARFIYGPLIDDRVRTIADGVAPSAYGRREVWQVKQALKPLGPIKIPREFVLMDRAAIGLGAVMLHLQAELNFHEIFAATIDGFDVKRLSKRQQGALAGAGLRQPDPGT